LSFTLACSTSPCDRQNARADGVGRAVQAQRPVLQEDLPRTGLAQTEQRLGQFGSTRSHQSGQADDLAGLNREGDGRAADVQAQPLDSQQGFVRAGRRRMIPLEEQFQLATDHEPDHRFMADLVALQFTGVLSVAQDSHPVCYLIDLHEPMRDVQHAHAVAFQVADHGEEPIGVALRQAGRRFVHDEDARFQGQGPGDLDELLLPDRQAGNGSARRAIQAEAAGDDLGVGIDARIDQSKRTAPARFAAQEDVPGHVEVLGEVQFLVNENDAAALGVIDAVEMHRLAVQQDRAGIRSFNPGEDLHQGGFAGAVLADDREHLAAPQVDVDVFQGLHAGKGLRYASCFEKERHGGLLGLSHRGHPFAACGLAVFARPQVARGGSAPLELL
jgi:hypothetical protein